MKVVEGIIDSLNEVCTRKVMKELSKTEAAQPGCNVDITKAIFVISSNDDDGSEVGISNWICVSFDDLKTQNEAEAKLREEAPLLLALSLPSTVFATKQSLNFARQSGKLMERKKVMAHTSFAVKLCVMQSKSGRTFMIEQPVGARARGTQLMNKLLFREGALRRLHGDGPLWLTCNRCSHECFKSMRSRRTTLDQSRACRMRSRSST